MRMPTKLIKSEVQNSAKKWEKQQKIGYFLDLQKSMQHFCSDQITSLREILENRTCGTALYVKTLKIKFRKVVRAADGIYDELVQLSGLRTKINVDSNDQL